MKINRNQIICTIAVFCVYLMLALPVAFAQSLPQPVTVNIKKSDNSGTLATAELKTFDDLLTTDIKAGNASHVKILIQRRGPAIKNGYIWLCGSLDLSQCMFNEDIRKNPIVMSPNGFDGSRAWVDITRKTSSQYPQTGNMLILVNLEVGTQEVWTGSWYSLRTGTSKLQDPAPNGLTVSSVQVNSLDVILKDDSTAAVVKDFIEKNSMLPLLWLKDVNSIVFGPVGVDNTKAVHTLGFDATDRPENFETAGKELNKVVNPSTFDKQYTLLFPEGSLASPVVAFKNTPPVCGQDSDKDGNPCDRSLGETEISCCQDCGCQTGFACSGNPKDTKAAGLCVDTAQIQLVYRGAKKTAFKSCELGNDVEFDAEFLNLPTGSKIQDFFYNLNGNKTRTDIRCTKDNEISVKEYYNCEFSIDVSDQCGKDKQFTFTNNSVSAILVLPDKSTKTLTAQLDDLTIKQTFISMNEISDFVSAEMTRLTDRMDAGIKKAEKLLDTCIDFIENAINFAYTMAIIAGFTTLLTLGKTLYNWYSGSPQQTNRITETKPDADGKPVVISETIKETTGGVKDNIADMLLGVTRVFLESIGLAVEVGMNICNVANTVIKTYTEISKALATYTTFQVCVKAYQNMVGQGACSGGDSNNPRASISAALNCVSTLQQCTGYLNQMSSQLDGFEGWTQSQIKKYQTNQPKSKRAYLNLIEDGFGETRLTCSDRYVKFDGDDRACTSAASVTLEYVGSGQIMQDIQTDVRKIENEASILNNNLIPQLWSVSANVNIDKVRDNIVASASRIQTSATQIKNSPSVTPAVKSLAENIHAEAEIVKTQALGTPERVTIETAGSNVLSNVRSISGQLKETSTKRDITFDALGGRWSSPVQASEIFGTQSGEYEVVFNCPGVGNSQSRIKYITDPQECERQHATTALTAGPSCNKKPTTDYGLSMKFKITTKAGDVKELKRQRDCNYYLNTKELTVVFNNKDITRGTSDLGQCWIDSKQKLGAGARRGAVIATGKFTKLFTGKTWLPGEALDPLVDEFDVTIDNSIWNVGKEDVEFLYTCEDVAGTNKETYTETVILQPGLSDDQVTGTVVGAGTTGTKATTTNLVSGTVSRGGDYTAAVRLNYPISAKIARCVIDFGDGQTEEITGTSGGTVTHTYATRQASYQLTYYCSDSNQTLVEQKQNFASFATPASTAIAPGPSGGTGTTSGGTSTISGGVASGIWAPTEKVFNFHIFVDNIPDNELNFRWNTQQGATGYTIIGCEENAATCNENNNRVKLDVTDGTTSIKTYSGALLNSAKTGRRYKFFIRAYKSPTDFGKWSDPYTITY